MKHLLLHVQHVTAERATLTLFFTAQHNTFRMSMLFRRGETTPMSVLIVKRYSFHLRKHTFPKTSCGQIQDYKMDDFDICRYQDSISFHPFNISTLGPFLLSTSSTFRQASDIMHPASCSTVQAYICNSSTRTKMMHRACATVT